MNYTNTHMIFCYYIYYGDYILYASPGNKRNKLILAAVIFFLKYTISQ